jgi:hypothetical protein
MSAYLGVFTPSLLLGDGTDGKFTISGLDPGTYEITAWHERLGRRRRRSRWRARHEDPELQVRLPREVAIRRPAA